MKPTKLLTAQEIARELDVPEDRVYYALRRGNIQPAALASQTKIYSKEAIPLVLAVLKGIEARRDQLKARRFGG